VTAEELLVLCLDQPGAWPDEPWEGVRVAKVGRPGKIFVFTELGGAGEAALKVRPEDRDALLAAFPGTVRDAPYLSRRHWVRISLDAFPDDELRDLVDTSFRLVCAGLPKAQRPV
jgi:predicted DNA-binding protein (MmcQ/YjbR family)